MIFVNADGDSPATLGDPDDGEVLLKVYPALPATYSLGADATLATDLTYLPDGAARNTGVMALCYDDEIVGAKAVAITRLRPRVCYRYERRSHPEPRRWRDEHQQLLESFEESSAMQRNAGFSLLEVLISIVILSIGLLGTAGLMGASLRSTNTAYYRSQATVLADDIMDRMRANITQARAQQYDIDAGPAYSRPPAGHGALRLRRVGRDAGRNVARRNRHVDVLPVSGVVSIVIVLGRRRKFIRRRDPAYDPSNPANREILCSCPNGRTEPGRIDDRHDARPSDRGRRWVRVYGRNADVSTRIRRAPPGRRALCVRSHQQRAANDWGHGLLRQNRRKRHLRLRDSLVHQSARATACSARAGRRPRHDDRVQRLAEHSARGCIEGISRLEPNRAGSTITVASHDLEPGDLLVANDCNQLTVFQATAGTTSPTIMHAAGGTPGNTTENLGEAASVYTFDAGARIYRLAASTYYVDVNPAGQPALYRSRPAGLSRCPRRKNWWKASKISRCPTASISMIRRTAKWIIATPAVLT